MVLEHIVGRGFFDRKDGFVDFALRASVRCDGMSRRARRRTFESCSMMASMTCPT